MTGSNGSKKITRRSKRLWVWVETTSGLSCLDIEAIIGISAAHDKFGNGCYDLHLASGTIFTIMAKDLDTITSKLPDWEFYGDEE